MVYTQRLTRPTSKIKYYITTSKGGYSKAIEGKCKSTGKPDTQCNVLANCVGYAYGRFHEIIGDPTMSYLSPVNAELFPKYATRCKQGSTPKIGAVIVWQRGTLASSDGAGHVAIVENIISDTEIIISQSGYNSKEFWTESCYKKNGKWICNWMNATYKFSCFIYNPAVDDNTEMLLSKGSKGKYVKELQTKLNAIGSYGLKVDGIFGATTEKAVKEFQTKYNLKSDGVVGEATWTSINNYYNKPSNVKDLSINLNNKKVTLWNTVINDVNYIRLMDLEKLGVAISYNSSNKMFEVKTK